MIHAKTRWSNWIQFVNLTGDHHHSCVHGCGEDDLRIARAEQQAKSPKKLQRRNCSIAILHRDSKKGSTFPKAPWPTTRSSSKLLGPILPGLTSLPASPSIELPALLLLGARSSGTFTRGESSTIAPMAAKSADLNGVAVSAEVLEVPRAQAACTQSESPPLVRFSQPGLNIETTLHNSCRLDH